MTRSILPDRRPCERFPFQHENFTCIATIGRNWDLNNRVLKLGQVAEIFIDVAGMKSGTSYLAGARDGGLMLSLAIQHGVSLETLAASLSRNEDGSASGVMGAAVDAILREGK